MRTQRERSRFRAVWTFLFERRALKVGAHVLLFAVLLASAASPNMAELAAEIQLTATGHPEVQSILLLSSIGEGPDPWELQRTLASHRVPLNPQGTLNGDGRPFVHWVTGEQPKVVWSRNSGGSFEIVASTFDPSQGWSDPAVWLDASIDGRDPVLVQNRTTGLASLVYWSFDAGASGAASVWRVDSTDALQSWSQPLEFSSMGVDAKRPSATLLNGELWVAYESELPNGNVELVAASDSAQTYETVTTVDLSGDPERIGNLSVEFESGGGQLWLRWVDTSSALGWSRRESGSWIPVVLAPYSGVEQRDIHEPGEVRKLAIFP